MKATLVDQGCDFAVMEEQIGALLEEWTGCPLLAVYDGYTGAFSACRRWISARSAAGCEFSLSIEGVEDRAAYYFTLLRAARRSRGRLQLLERFSDAQPQLEHGFTLWSLQGLPVYRGRLLYAGCASGAAGPNGGKKAAQLFGLRGEGAIFSLRGFLSPDFFEAARPIPRDVRFELAWNGAVLPLSGPALSGGHEVCFIIKELQMEDVAHESSGISVSLGEVEISWADLARLRPGSVLAIGKPEDLEAMILLGGRAWAAAGVEYREGELFLTVSGLTALDAMRKAAEASAPFQDPQETSGVNRRLIGEMLADLSETEE